MIGWTLFAQICILMVLLGIIVQQVINGIQERRSFLRVAEREYKPSEKTS